MTKSRALLFRFYAAFRLVYKQQSLSTYLMDEGTMKTPIPKDRLYWCFCSGWYSNFVGSESDQKQSVKLLQNVVYNITQYPQPPSPTQTHCLYILQLWEGWRGGVGQRGGRGATVHKRDRKYQHD